MRNNGTTGHDSSTFTKVSNEHQNNVCNRNLPIVLRDARQPFEIQVRYNKSREIRKKKVLQEILHEVGIGLQVYKKQDRPTRETMRRLKGVGVSACSIIRQSGTTDQTTTNYNWCSVSNENL